MKHWTEVLTRLNACPEAVEWAKTQPDLATAWKNCERGDWMLWLAGKWVGKPESKSRKRLVLAACACARLALPHVRSGEGRPLATIETAERWATGKEGVTLSQVHAYAADAADAAAAAAYAAYAAYVADAAADAAAYAAYVARTTTLKQCADLVREHHPKPPTRRG